MKKEFKEAIEDSPIIAAIKDDEGLKKCLTSESLWKNCNGSY